MADSQKREKLLALLDKKAFDPVLKASPNDYSSEADKEKLQGVQRTTRNTQHSYHEKYKTAEAVNKNFHDDLHSEPAKKVHRTLRDLKLPTIEDVKDEFEKLADE